MANDIVVRDRNTLASLLARPEFVERVKPYLSNPRVLAKYVSGILSTANKSPKIFQCTQASVMRCACSLAELNLSTGVAMPEAHIVPFGNEAVLIPDYRGLIKIACRSGRIKRIVPQEVRKGDKFSIKAGDHPEIVHEPALEGETTEGNLQGVYVIAHFDDGAWQHEWMTKDSIDAIKRRSRASGSGPWVTDYVAMARKTVIRRLCKYLPLADEDRMDLDKLFTEEDRAEGWITVEATEVPEGQSRTDALADRVAKMRSQEPAEPQEAPRKGRKRAEKAPVEQEPAPDTQEGPDEAETPSEPQEPLPPMEDDDIPFEGKAEAPAETDEPEEYVPVKLADMEKCGEQHVEVRCRIKRVLSSPKDPNESLVTVYAGPIVRTFEANGPRPAWAVSDASTTLQMTRVGKGWRVERYWQRNEES